RCLRGRGRRAPHRTRAASSRDRAARRQSADRVARVRRARLHDRPRDRGVLGGGGGMSGDLSWLRGSIVALATPFKDGAIDYPALEALVEWQIASGQKALVPCGSTGESATLTHDEHIEVVEAVIKVAAGRVPVIAGTGSNSTAEAIRLTREAERAGAAGALLISPYYNKPTQDGI